MKGEKNPLLGLVILLKGWSSAIKSFYHPAACDVQTQPIIWVDPGGPPNKVWEPCRSGWPSWFFAIARDEDAELPLKHRIYLLHP